MKEAPSSLLPTFSQHSWFCTPFKKYLELLASREDGRKKIIVFNNSISQCLNDLNFGLNVYDEQLRRENVQAIETSIDGIRSLLTKMWNSKELAQDIKFNIDMIYDDIVKSHVAL